MSRAITGGELRREVVLPVAAAVISAVVVSALGGLLGVYVTSTVLGQRADDHDRRITTIESDVRASLQDITSRLARIEGKLESP